MNQPTPPMPEQPPILPPAQRKSRTNLIIVGAAVAIIAAIIGTGVVVVQAQDDSKPATTEASAPAEDVAAPAVEEADEPDPDPTFPPLSADDFTMTLRTTDRQCFGSAGCNVTVEPKLEFTGNFMDIDPDAIYEITYEIRGGDSGPVIETAELMDETTLNYTPTSISTPSSSTKVTVEVTDVITQGA
ncbi:hypothetical protein ACH4NO_18105 [Streptomyces olivaceus]|uniref:hypothetical protein n=1 Tax=Streptomyces olivaceus TaxID=47716 RepID=UPI00378EAE11